jgi:hypothetical protein
MVLKCFEYSQYRTTLRNWEVEASRAVYAHRLKGRFVKSVGAS